MILTTLKSFWLNSSEGVDKLIVYYIWAQVSINSQIIENFGTLGLVSICMFLESMLKLFNSFNGTEEHLKFVVFFEILNFYAGSNMMFRIFDLGTNINRFTANRLIIFNKHIAEFLLLFTLYSHRRIPIFFSALNALKNPTHSLRLMQEVLKMHIIDFLIKTSLSLKKMSSPTTSNLDILYLIVFIY